MIHQEFNFNFLNTKFYGQQFTADTTKGVVIILHGLGSHSSRYKEFVIPKLLENDISVIAYDQFGHGKTEGKRGHTPSFEALLDCVSLIVKKAEETFKGVPLFLYGHSMGGNVALNFILRKKHSFQGVIATSPFLRIAFTPPAWKLRAGKILQKIAPSMTMPNELDPKAISRDLNEVEKYTKDPLIHNKVSANYSLTFFETGEWAIKNAASLKTPTLVLHGTADTLTDPKASKEFVDNSNGTASLVLFEGAYHELHYELEREKFIAIIIQWIQKNSERIT